MMNRLCREIASISRRSISLPSSSSSSHQSVILYSLAASFSSASFHTQAFSRKNKEVSNATSIFNAMLNMNPLPSVSDFNKLLSNAADREPYPVVLRMFDKMRKRDLSFDDETFTIAKSMFDDMITTTPLPFFVQFTQLLSLVVYMGHYYNALQLFDKMRHSRVPYSEFTLSVVTDCYCRLDRVDLGYAVFGMLLKSGLEPNVINFNTLIHGLCKGGRVKDAEEVFVVMRQRSVDPSIVTYNTLLDGYCQGNASMGTAREMLNIVSYNSLTNGYCVIRFVDLGFAVLGTLLKSGLEPNVTTFNTLIKGLLLDNKIAEAEVLFRKLSIEKLCELNEVTFNTVIHGFCMERRMKDAECVLAAMMRRNVGPNIVTYTALIDGYCQLGLMEKSRKIFDFVLDYGLKPNIITYNSMMKGYCMKGDADKAWSLFREVPFVGLQRNNVSYSTMLDGLFAAGRCDDGCNLFIEMQAGNITPDVVTYTTLIDGLCRNKKIDKAFSVLRMMEDDSGVSPNIATYTALIDGLLKDKKLESARNIFHSLPAKGLRPDVKTFTLMIGELCEEGLIDEAKDMFVEMEKCGCSPNSVTYNVFVKGCLGLSNFLEVKRLLEEMDRKRFLLRPDVYSMLHRHCEVGSGDDGVSIDMIKKLAPKDQHTSL